MNTKEILQTTNVERLVGRSKPSELIPLLKELSRITGRPLKTDFGPLVNKLVESIKYN